MTHGVYAAVDGAKTPRTDAVRNCLAGHTRGPKLATSDDAMLAVCPSASHALRMLAPFYLYRTFKVRTVGHGEGLPALAAPLVRGV